MSASDPTTCPFCGGDLPSPGKGFTIHVNEHPECEAEFDRWREALDGDLVGGPE